MMVVILNLRAVHLYVYVHLYMDLWYFDNYGFLLFLYACDFDNYGFSPYTGKVQKIGELIFPNGYIFPNVYFF